MAVPACWKRLGGQQEWRQKETQAPGAYQATPQTTPRRAPAMCSLQPRASGR